MTRTLLAIALSGAALLVLSPLAATAADDLLPEAPAKALLLGQCTTCHDAALVTMKRRTHDEWDEVMGKMVDRGAALTDEEQDQVVDYLTKNFGPANAVAAAPATAATPPSETPAH